MNEDRTNELIERLQSQGVPRIPRAVARGFMLIAGGDVLQAIVSRNSIFPEIETSDLVNLFGIFQFWNF